MHRGSCLCRSVRYEIDGELGDFGYCHCTSCRKASGSGHAANAPVDRAAFRLLSGADSLREYQSSPGKIRSFCSRCGSPIYVHRTATPEILRVRLGSLDSPFAKRPQAHIFVSDKADWEPIEDALPQFAEWAPKSVLDLRGSAQGEAGNEAPVTKPAVKLAQVTPLFASASMEKSLRFYVDGLGFEMTRKWVDEGQLRWCWLQRGGASVMLQQFRTEGHDSWTPQGKLGEGVSTCIFCDDAVAFYREVQARGLTPSRPFVGNGLWVTSLSDPDGYRLEFESPTDVAEDTVLAEPDARHPG